MKLSAQEIQGPFQVHYSVNQFVLFLVDGPDPLELGRYYDKASIKKEIEDHGLKNVTYHGMAVDKILAA